MNDRRRIVVAGGAGFLGSHLVDRLLADSHDVICVDNVYTGRKANILHLLPNPRFELRRHDVTMPLYIEVDAIYNRVRPLHRELSALPERHPVPDPLPLSEAERLIAQVGAAAAAS